MRLRVEVRIRIEQALRVIVIAALAVLLWESLHPRTRDGAGTVTSRGIGAAALARWTALAAPPKTIQLRLDGTPSPLQRAWLGALAGAGSEVSWSGDVSPLMIDAQHVASPSGGTRVLVSAASGSSVVVGDDVGVIDTVQTQNDAAALTLGAVVGTIVARVNGAVASAAPADSVLLRRVLVIGAAGWESKFVAAALEEKGWKVDARFPVAPGVTVTQGSAMIDTARYSAVIALDGAAAPYANRIARFARGGGGVVLGPEAASLEAMASLRAGTVARRTPAAGAVQGNGSATLAALARSPITSLRADAVPLETRGGAVTLAARRLGAGRSIQIGYEDTWRWRMSGSDGAVREHRDWWTGLVSRVAYAPSVSDGSLISAKRTRVASNDEAPFAGLVSAIGPASSTGVTKLASARRDWLAILFLLLVTALLGEVVLRRLRGVP